MICKHELFMTLVAALVVLPVTAAVKTQTPLALAPFTFAGRIVDYAHVAYDADASVEVRIKNAAGTLLAKTTTATSGATVYNYVIDVPVSSTALAGHATVGEAVSFEFVDPSGVVYAGLAATTNATVGLPGALKRLDVVLASDANNDGVADEYEESIAYLMWINGIENYDATADYDGDGQSNYAEYVAGTNPFDATDRFSIRQMAMDEGVDDFVALRVPVNRGRSYTVATTPELNPAEWRSASFTLDPDVAPSATHLNTGAYETGYRTIFVPKEGAHRFYKVNVE